MAGQENLDSSSHGTAPSRHWVAITPNDSADLPQECRIFICATAGNLHATDLEGNELTRPIPAGVIPLGLKKVFEDTTAAGLTGLV